jgi:hypothetical protein
MFCIPGDIRSCLVFLETVKTKEGVMKKLIIGLTAVASIAVFTGCVAPMGPVGGVGAMVYTDVSGPVLATGNAGASKMGQAESTGIVFFATGDSSLKKAMENGGITKISYADYHTKSVLGIYAKTIVTVYGE